MLLRLPLAFYSSTSRRAKAPLLLHLQLLLLLLLLPAAGRAGRGGLRRLADDDGLLRHRSQMVGQRLVLPGFVALARSRLAQRIYR